MKLTVSQIIWLTRSTSASNKRIRLKRLACDNPAITTAMIPDTPKRLATKYDTIGNDNSNKRAPVTSATSIFSRKAMTPRFNKAKNSPTNIPPIIAQNRLKLAVSKEKAPVVKAVTANWKEIKPLASFKSPSIVKMDSTRFGNLNRFAIDKNATASVGASAAPKAKLAAKGTSTGNNLPVT